MCECGPIIMFAGLIGMILLCRALGESMDKKWKSTTRSHRNSYYKGDAATHESAKFDMVKKPIKPGKSNPKPRFVKRSKVQANEILANALNDKRVTKNVKSNA